MQKEYNPIRAAAQILGDTVHPELSGLVTFTQFPNGVLVQANICGLHQNDVDGAVFAFHIHEGSSCTGTTEDPFADARGHYNPGGTEHPFHAGDLPPLFENQGCAEMSVLTNRFTVSEIVGRVVIVHANSDDFVTQPSGNAGRKIGCGKIFAR